MKSKIIIVISTQVGLGFAIVITILVPILGPKYFTDRLDKAGSMENLLKMAGQLNKSLPMMVDKEMQLTTVTATENALIYNYTLVNTEKANISAEKLATALK